jgi:UDP-N-acetyl-D-glucosamine dehydrogenase
LIEKIDDRSAVVAVVGLGYVGLPVAVAFARAGFDVIGVDLDRDKVALIESGRSHLRDVEDSEVAPLRTAGKLKATTSFAKLKDADAILICVPTPLKDGNPDLSRVVAAGTSVGKVLKAGTVVVLESTTYPGTTEDILKPLLEAGGLVAGRDFLLAFSPERIDPGNPTYKFEDMPKIVGGMNEDSTAAAAALYGQVVPKIAQVSGTREAELAKLIENTFRHVNIALINELAVYAREMGIDIWEAIDAAASKPFGFLPFYPGPGWGGHCIPLDPAYLSWRIRQDRAHEVRFVELAHRVNAEMPLYVTERISLALNEQGKSIRDARVLVIGMAYKGGTADTRESSGLKILRALMQRGAEVGYHDPLVESVEIDAGTYRSQKLSPEFLRSQDLVVILVPQVDVDWVAVEKDATAILDCCNALGHKSKKVERL